MTYGELFAGIGGLSLGLDRAGMECRFQVEIDTWCRRVLEKHWPGVPKYGDVTQVTGAELGYVDVLAGGFPCQDVSQAGKRAGMFDSDGRTTRTGLWVEFARLIGELRPRYVVAENVPGILTSRGAMGRVTGDLAARGYLGFYIPVRASAFGASHIRKRVFIVGIRRDGYVADAGHAGERRAEEPARLDWRGASGDDCRTGGTLGDSASARFGSGEPGAGGEIRDRARRPESGGRCDAVADSERAERRSNDDRGGHPRKGADGEGQASGRAGERSGAVPDSGIPRLPDAEQAQLSGPKRDDEGRAVAELCGALADVDDSKHGKHDQRQGQVREADKWPVEGRPKRRITGPSVRLPVFAPGPADPRWPDILRARPDLAPAIDIEEWEAALSGFCDVAHGVSAGLVRSAMKDRTRKLKGLGNAVVPACAEYIGRLIIKHAQR